LQSKKVVEYLVGAGSHPELTRRCSSILQFLIVTNQLTPEIREALWRPLVENKDSRTVSASMSLINDSSAHGWPLELCVDYCRRASAVPVTNFEPAMPGFIRKLVEVTLQACDNDPDQKVSSASLLNQFAN
jgi:ubiquitin carboxyl-terminal hydrolase 34